jgi:tetratricopeptide (TPR) repeat protein
MSSSVHQDIVDLLRHYVNTREITALLRNAAVADTIETGLASKKRRRAPGSFADGATLDQTITYCRGKLTTVQYAELLCALGDIFLRYGSLGKAAEMFSSLVDAPASSFDARDIAQARVRRARVSSQQGKWSEAIADLGESKAVFLREGDALSVGVVENLLGTVYAESGKTEEALACIGRALARFEHAGNAELIGTALMNMGIVHNIKDEYDNALSHYARAKSFLEGVGDGTRLAELHHNIGMTYLSRNLYKQASREFDLSLSIGTKQHNMNLLGLAHLGKANVHYHLNDLPTALRLVNKALEPFSAAGDRLSIADSYKVKGMIHREMKKYNFAESYLQTSLRMNLELSNRLNAAETYVEIGLLEQKRGHWKEATAAFQSAQRYFAMVGAQNQAHRMEAANLRRDVDEIR